MVDGVTRKPPGGAAVQRHRCQVFTLLQPQGCVCCRFAADGGTVTYRTTKSRRLATPTAENYIKNLRFQYVNGPPGIMHR